MGPWESCHLSLTAFSLVSIFTLFARSEGVLKFALISTVGSHRFAACKELRIDRRELRKSARALKEQRFVSVIPGKKMGGSAERNAKRGFLD